MLPGWARRALRSSTFRRIAIAVLELLTELVRRGGRSRAKHTAPPGA
jgi:hypothetical protein